MGKILLDEQVVDGVYAASEGVLDGQHRSVREVLRQSLKCVLEVFAWHRMPVGERSKNGTFRVRPRVALICGRQTALRRAILYGKFSLSHLVLLFCTA